MKKNKLKITYRENGNNVTAQMKFDKDECLDIVTVFSVFLDAMESTEFKFDRDRVLNSLQTNTSRFEI